MKIPIVCFHHLCVDLHYTEYSIEKFRLLISRLSTKYNFTNTAEISRKNISNPIILTFDDCYKDIFETLIWATNEYNIKPILYPVSGYIGERSLWNSKANYFSQHLTIRELAFLVKCGCEIGCHTHTHQNLTKFKSEDDLDREVKYSKTFLEDTFSQKILSLSLPFGTHNEFVRKYSNKFFSHVFSTERKSSETDFFSSKAIRRIVVSKNCSVESVYR